MKLGIRIFLSMFFCLGLLTACQKEFDDHSRLDSLQQQNEELRNLVLGLQTRSDSIVNALEASQQEQASLKIAIDSINRKLDSMLNKIGVLNDSLVRQGADINNMKRQLEELTRQYQELLAQLNELATQSCTIYSGLLAYYPFSGNVWDSSGKRYDGTIINSVGFTADRLNQPNAAIQINGGNGHRITTPVPFNFQRTDSFTIAFWFQDAGNTSGRIVSTENPEGNFRISSYREGRYAFQYGGYYVYDTVQLNTWNHVVYSYSAKTIKLYKNGKLKFTTTDPGSEPLNYGNGLTIGSKAASAYDSWNGKIDEMRIYNRALNAQEVNWLYSH
ncbi:LamG domain-containing protein [Flavihumibacter sp. ZG627]|uniref:LamG domain-containing protein n=1 Tax=Flavihumibacter sp. ZG627 TaxID=1463156 RepID=UPI00058299D8|nr:LamG domain-containing protein [Flavihumibacter sp. ZG627]KIC90815.1 hypothetical protein HY58_07110 [Flavihumibacter sp. ZG627]